MYVGKGVVILLLVHCRLFVFFRGMPGLDLDQIDAGGTVLVVVVGLSLLGCRSADLLICLAYSHFHGFDNPNKGPSEVFCSQVRVCYSKDHIIVVTVGFEQRA